VSRKSSDVTQTATHSARPVLGPRVPVPALRSTRPFATSAASLRLSTAIVAGFSSVELNQRSPVGDSAAVGRPFVRSFFRHADIGPQPTDWTGPRVPPLTRRPRGLRIPLVRGAHQLKLGSDTCALSMQRVGRPERAENSTESDECRILNGCDKHWPCHFRLVRRMHMRTYTRMHLRMHMRTYTNAVTNSCKAVRPSIDLFPLSPGGAHRAVFNLAVRTILR
jgi:hypothetical protein